MIVDSFTVADKIADHFCHLFCFIAFNKILGAVNSEDWYSFTKQMKILIVLKTALTCPRFVLLWTLILIDNFMCISLIKVCIIARSSQKIKWK